MGRALRKAEQVTQHAPGLGRRGGEFEQRRLPGARGPSHHCPFACPLRDLRPGTQRALSRRDHAVRGPRLFDRHVGGSSGHCARLSSIPSCSCTRTRRPFRKEIRTCSCWKERPAEGGRSGPEGPAGGRPLWVGWWPGCDCALGPAHREGHPCVTHAAGIFWWPPVSWGKESWFLKAVLITGASLQLVAGGGGGGSRAWSDLSLSLRPVFFDKMRENAGLGFKR